MILYIVYDIIKWRNIRLERRDKINYLYDVETHILVTIDTKETVNNLYNNLQRVFRRFFGVTVKLQEYYKNWYSKNYVTKNDGD